MRAGAAGAATRLEFLLVMYAVLAARSEVYVCGLASKRPIELRLAFEKSRGALWCVGVLAHQCLGVSKKRALSQLNEVRETH